MSDFDVILRRQASVLEVEPACDKILAPYLTYTHRKMVTRRGKREWDFTPTPLFKCQEGKLLTSRGFLYRVSKVLKDAGLKTKVEDYREGSYPEPDYSRIQAMNKFYDGKFELRETQKEILAKIETFDLGIFDVPTATGKTTLLKLLAFVYPTAKIIFATPEQALARDLHVSLSKMLGAQQVGGVYTGCNDSNSGKRILAVCSFSLMKCHLDKVKLFFFDEVHRSAAPSFHTALSHVGGTNKCRIFGLSATPEGRSDNADLVIESFFGPRIHVSNYEDEVERGSIVPIKVYVAECAFGPNKLNMSPVKATRRAIWRNVHRNQIIVKAVRWAQLTFGEDAQQLIVVDKLEHGLVLSTMLPEFDLTYASYNAKLVARLKKQGVLPSEWSPHPREWHYDLRDKFCKGAAKKVIATNYHTGIDAPQLKVVILASGESSKISVVQKAGRVSRIHGDKECGVLIDIRDTFHFSIENRYIKRMREYKRKKWEIHKLDNEFIRLGL